MNDDVIPLDEIGKIETVKVYNQAYVDKLEKENAELKKENQKLKEKLKPENCLKLLAKDGYIKFTSEQLTKAKEIIKNLMVFAEMDDREYEKEYKEAEQFLKGVEK